jgi:adenylate cyclase
MHFSGEIFGVHTTYPYELARLWPNKILATTILFLIVWVHACIGIHFWLRNARWYRRVAPVLAILSTIVPTLALAGFASGGREMALAMADPERAAQLRAAWKWPEGEAAATLAMWRSQAVTVFAVLLAAAFGAVLLRSLRRWSVPRVPIAYVSGPTISAPVGPTLLEISRARRVPHAAVCGGRARCSTCRVRVTEGAEALAPPNAAERRTLAAIGAGPDVRLACQLRIANPATVLRLVRVDAAPAAQLPHLGPTPDGVERTLAVLFFDLRGFTKASQGRLPYDVVFTLNRLFAEVGEAIRAEQGWIDKYMGDGLMAVFGRETGPEEGCRQALRAAAGAARAMARLGAEPGNDPHHPAADDPLHGRFAYAMGLHVGPLVLGRIGHADSARLTVIGEAVNVASRLETEAKARNAGLVVSLEMLEQAGVRLDELSPRAEQATLTLRGVDAPVEAAIFDAPADMTCPAPTANRPAAAS